VVRAIHRGAFAVAAAAKSELSAGGNLFEASVKQKLGVFDGDGYQEACDGARQKGARMSGCDEPLRIELQPILRVTPPAPPPLAVSTEDPPRVVVIEPPPPPGPAPERRRAGRSPAVRVLVAEKVAVEPGPSEEPRPPAAGGVCGGDMVRIGGGTFSMGSGDDEEGSSPGNQVTVGRYCLDRTEVTVAAYARCSLCRRPATGGLCNAPGMGKDNHPQNCVSWNDAETYCGWASKRLPTEAEWEFAARRGGTSQPFPWGDARPTPERACYNRWSSEARGTCAVGRFPDGPFGLADMAGNVWEWVADWYGPFAPNDPRATPSNGVGRVMRGGGWTSSRAADLGTSSRAATWPTNRDDYLGFRCAL
jgi:formylglycine-generating enzyme required for sulfatase activity